MICIYSIKYLISGKCDLDPVAKPQQASNHTIVLVRVKPSKICHIAHVLMKFECSIKYFYIHLNCKWFLGGGGGLLIKGVSACQCLQPGFPFLTGRASALAVARDLGFLYSNLHAEHKGLEAGSLALTKHHYTPACLPLTYPFTRK